MQFELDECEIELQFTVSHNANVKGGVSFWFYTAEAGADIGSASVQKVRVKLKSPGTTLISDVEQLSKAEIAST